LGSPCPRGRFLGGRLLGDLFADELDDPIDFYDFLKIHGIIDDSEDCECDELDEYVEHLDNQRW
jgi:hypothetical protein